MASGSGKLAAGPADMRRPPKREVWLHIDRFGGRDKKCWAVQWTNEAGELCYRTCTHWEIGKGPWVKSSEWDTPKAQHPRAVVVVTQVRDLLFHDNGTLFIV